MAEQHSIERYREYTMKLRALLVELPSFCAEFFRGIDSVSTPLTRYAYAVDLKTFFTFLTDEIPSFEGRKTSELTLADLDRVTTTDIEIYLEYLSLYVKDEAEISNGDRAKARKLSTLRALYKYFYRKQKITSNPPSLVDAPKLHEKPIIRLEPNEVAYLLDTVNEGTGLSERQKKFFERTRRRDIAILTLFLGTGIRISELVGINIDDINFLTNEFTITRKGGNRDMLSFGDEVRDALLDYLNERETANAAPGSENALFLSLQRTRIGARAVENLVKKYASIAAPLKKISPHKLRSTYGTMLYRNTNDIYLVANVLGHKDVNTTRKHYAAVSEDWRREAARRFKLREDDGHTPDMPDIED